MRKAPRTGAFSVGSVPQDLVDVEVVFENVRESAEKQLALVEVFDVELDALSVHHGQVPLIKAMNRKAGEPVHVLVLVCYGQVGMQAVPVRTLGAAIRPRGKTRGQDTAINRRHNLIGHALVTPFFMQLSVERDVWVTVVLGLHSAAPELILAPATRVGMLVAVLLKHEGPELGTSDDDAHTFVVEIYALPFADTQFRHAAPPRVFLFLHKKGAPILAKLLDSVNNPLFSEAARALVKIAKSRIKVTFFEVGPKLLEPHEFTIGCLPKQEAA